MKTSHILKISIVLIFCCSSVVFADNSKHDSRKKNSKESHYTQNRHDDRHNDNERSDRNDGRHDQKYSDYHKHHGYRERPHDRGRHYGHYKYRGHQYDYHGHWNSWAQWHRYAEAHPQISRHGHYYRENAHLMFRFCEPGTGNCFFFSIGR